MTIIPATQGAEAGRVPGARYSLIPAWVVSEEYILELSNGLTIYKSKTFLKIKINLNLVFYTRGLPEFHNYIFRHFAHDATFSFVKGCLCRFVFFSCSGFSVVTKQMALLLDAAGSQAPPKACT